MATTREKPTGDRRVRRTLATLQSALIQLVEEKDLGQVSVSDVVEVAGVSRSTFYDHYADVHELAEAACTSTIDSLIESLPVLDPGLIETPEDPERSLLDFFTNLAEHAGLYRSLLGPQGSARVIDHIRRRITAAVHIAVRLADARDDEAPGTVSSADVPHDVPAAFIAGSLIGVATDWLQRGCPLPPAEMATLTWPLLIRAATPPRDTSTAAGAAAP